VFAQAITNTTTSSAPWHIIPADRKWLIRTIVGEIIVHKLQSLDLHHPTVTLKQKRILRKLERF